MPLRDLLKVLVKPKDVSHQSSSSFLAAEASSGAEGPPSVRENRTPSIAVGENYGIKVWYDGGDGVDVDIIFVYGLTGNAYTTWAHKESGVHWPSQLLKEDLPNTQGLTFGYDANIVNMLGKGPAGNGRLINHAADLVSSLVREREKSGTEQRKIIFVAHSLGGLVVKRALNHSKHSDEAHLSQIEQCTIGILFFGVPHAGADLEGLASEGASVLNPLRTTNRAMLKVLDPDSEMLHHVEDDFQIILRERKDIHITCFYEKLRVSGMGEIVPQRSAKLSGHALYPIHANHMDMVRFASRENPGYVAIVGELRRWQKSIALTDHQASTSSSVCEFWTVLRRSSRQFTGRKELLDQLSREFTIENPDLPQEQRIYVIRGRGGTGKSEVCLRFAEMQRHRYWGVFWQDATSTGSLEKSITDIGRLCNVSKPNVQKVKAWLASRDERWLMIIDNADDPEIDLSPYIPDNRSGDVLITTRNPQCIIHNTVGHHELSDLEPDLARELLYKTLSMPESQRVEKLEAATAVTQCVGSHTLAIIQAAAFIKSKLCSLEAYPDLFRQKRSELMKFHSKQNASPYGNVYATFEVTAKFLEASKMQEYLDALDLIHVLAFMHNENIMETIFDKAAAYASYLSSPDNEKNGAGDTALDHTNPVSFDTPSSEAEHSKSPLNESGDEDQNTDCEDSNIKVTVVHPNDVQVNPLSPHHLIRLPEYLQQRSAKHSDRLRFHRAVGALESFSLIISTDMDGTLRLFLHPLVHAWAKERQSPAVQIEAWQATATILACSCEGIWGYSPFFSHLQSHVQTCTNQDIERYTSNLSDVEVVQLFLQLAYVLYRMNDYNPVKRLMTRTILILRQKGSQNQTLLKNLLFVMGRALNRLEDAEEAINIFTKLVWFESQGRPEHDRSVLRCQCELAGAYLLNKQFDEAKAMYERVVDLEENTVEEPDHDVLRSAYYELATTYYESGDNSKALGLFKHVVHNMMKELPEDHPDRQAAQRRLAKSLNDEGHFAEAIELYEHVVKIRGITYKESSLAGRLLENDLCQCYFSTEQWSVAVEFLERVVNFREGHLDQDDPDRLFAQYNLGLAYRADGQVEKAVALIEHVWEIEEPRLPDKDISRMNIQHNLAITLDMNGQYEEAVLLLEGALKSAERCLNKDDPDLLLLRRALAQASEALVADTPPI